MKGRGVESNKGEREPTIWHGWELRIQVRGDLGGGGKHSDQNSN